MSLPVDSYVRPVEGNDDLFAFAFPFDLEGKALVSSDDAGEYSHYIEEDGDLILAGWAAEFAGTDRQKENFMTGAFQEGIKSFVDGNASLCYHHKNSQLLGKVLELEDVEGKGLRFVARVDGAIKDHPELGTIYRQIKKGSLKGLSVGGFFKRKLTDAGRKISQVDFTEISVTPVPVHSKPAFSVVAGKALEDESEPVTEAVDTEALSNVLAGLDSVFTTVEGKAVKGDPQDLHFLALLLDLEKFSNNLASKEDTEEGEGGPEDDKVDALIVKTKDALDEIAREAHKLAAKLGPLPSVTYA